MYLRALAEKDINEMLEWMHDPEIQKCFRVNMADYTREDVRHFICSAEVKPVDGRDIHYAIADDNDEYLGTISLKSVDLVSSNAEYAISLRKCAQGKGIAAWATKEILRIAFEEFGFQRVYLNVLSDNQKAIRLYEKCGFVYEGTFRNHLLLRGEYKSLRWYSVLKEEYMQREGLVNDEDNAQ